MDARCKLSRGRWSKSRSQNSGASSADRRFCDTHFCDSSLEAILWYTQLRRGFMGLHWGGFYAGCED